MKKVLIITFYWPPSSGSGVQRWLKFSKYLPENNWIPIIITPALSYKYQQDPSYSQDINKRTKVIHVPAGSRKTLLYRLFNVLNRNRKQGIPSGKKESGILNKLIIWIRVNLIIPDLKLFWVLDSKKEILQIVKTEKPDVIVTTGPPHSIHFAGSHINRVLNIPWLADFRDPWSDWDIYHHFNISSMSRHIHEKLEKRVLNNASVVTTVSKYWVNKLGYKTSTPVMEITNGYDAEDFKNYQNTPSEKFRISYFGVLDEFRFVPDFWSALNELSTEHPALWSEIEIYMRGIIDFKLKDLIEQYPPLRDKVYIGDYMPHKKIVSEYNNSWILLLILYDAPNTAGTLTGKLFEYLASEKFILGLGNPTGEAGDIIRDTHSGIMLGFEDKTGIKQAIIEQYDKYVAREKSSSSDYEKFSRANLTIRLAEELKRLS